MCGQLFAQFYHALPSAALSLSCNCGSRVCSTSLVSGRRRSWSFRCECIQQQPSTLSRSVPSSTSFIAIAAACSSPSDRWGASDCSCSRGTRCDELAVGSAFESLSRAVLPGSASVPLLVSCCGACSSSLRAACSRLTPVSNGGWALKGSPRDFRPFCKPLLAGFVPRAHLPDNTSLGGRGRRRLPERMHSGGSDSIFLFCCPRRTAIMSSDGTGLVEGRGTPCAAGTTPRV